MYHFDPQGEALDARPSYIFKTGTLAGSAKVTFQIKRFTSDGNTDNLEALPYQLFGAMFGIHEVEDTNKYPNYRPQSSPDITEDIVDNLRERTEELLTTLDAAATLAAWQALPATAVSIAGLRKDRVLAVGLVVKWLPDGSLLIGQPYNTNAPAGYTSWVVISCKEIPYRSFLKALEDSVIKIDRVRMTYKNQDTLSEIWNLAGRSMFGATDGNDLIPTDYFEPNQQQANVIDVTQPLIIDGETALNSIMPVGESLISYICSVTEVINNNLRSE